MTTTAHYIPLMVVSKVEPKLWQICWKRAWYENEKFSWFYAEDAATAKEMLERILPEIPIIIWIEES